MKHIQALSVLMIFSLGIIIPGCEPFCGKCYCNNKDARDLPLNESFQMNFGELYCNPEQRITLSFNSFHEGRCPIGVYCIWEGNAQVQFTMESRKEGSSEFILNTVSGMLTDTTIQSIHFELLKLDPYPHVDAEYPQEVYTATVFISD